MRLHKLNHLNSLFFFFEKKKTTYTESNCTVNCQHIETIVLWPWQRMVCKCGTSIAFSRVEPQSFQRFSPRSVSVGNRLSFSRVESQSFQRFSSRSVSVETRLSFSRLSFSRVGPQRFQKKKNVQRATNLQNKKRRCVETKETQKITTERSCLTVRRVCAIQVLLVTLLPSFATES